MPLLHSTNARIFLSINPSQILSFSIPKQNVMYAIWDSSDSDMADNQRSEPYTVLLRVWSSTDLDDRPTFFNGFQ